MEIVILEKQVYEDLLHKIELIASRLELLNSLNSDKSLKQWFESQEVCDILGIYKESDIQALFEKYYHKFLQ